MSRRPADGDDGLILVWVALMMAVLLGFGALVIDVGALYREKRELQNGADAGALAAAKECAQQASCAGAVGGLAQTYADQNAHDSASRVDGVCGSGGGLPACPVTPSGTTGVTGWVQVSTSTRTSGGGNEVSFVLAPVMSAVSGSTVEASAVAAWGAAKTASTPPVAIALCSYTSIVGTGSLPSAAVTLYLHDTGKDTYADECAASPAGGFGWIQSAGCTSVVSADGTVGSDPGNNATQGCFKPHNKTTGLYKPGDLVPVGLYEEFAGSGSGATYDLVGIAALRIQQYTFPSSENPKGFKCPIPQENACLVGRFETLVTTGELGGGTNYGVSVVQMIG